MPTFFTIVYIRFAVTDLQGPTLLEAIFVSTNHMLAGQTGSGLGINSNAGIPVRAQTWPLSFT